MEALPLNKKTYTDFMHSTTGLPHNHRRTKSINTFCINLKKLADTLSSDIDINYRRIINYEANQSKFNQLFVSKYDDDSGNNIYAKLNSFYPLAIDNHPKFSGQYFNNNFEFAPLISQTGENEQLSAEKVLYKASVIPMYPMIFMSTIEAHETFGPSFLNSFSIRLSSMNSIPMVNISCSTKGGKVIQASKPLTTTYPTVEEKDYIELNSPKTGMGVTEINNDFKNLYRASTIIDCLLDVNESHKTLEQFKTKMFKKNNINNVDRSRIVEFDLEINNSIDFTYTQASNNFELVDDNLGPTFAKLSDRNVSGSITFYSISPNFITPIYESGLSMFFGGPFFYPIPYVNWNKPSVTANPGGGYLHKVTFKAKLPSKTGFYMDSLPVSEFDLKFSDLAKL
jgi:hypothetical protein